MRSLRALVLLTLLLLAARWLIAATTERTIEHGGLTRTWRLHVPEKVKDPAPLVFVFHGGGSNASQAQKMARFDALAETEGFLVCYPDGIGKNWNDGRESEALKAQQDKVDDVGFVSALIDAIAKEHPVDEKRIFSTGISNGGIFSHYLGANLSSRIAAIAPVVGGMADPFHKRFKPEKPVAVLIVQGTKDPLVPIDGGAIAGSIGKGRRGKIISTAEAVKLWVIHDQCRPEPVKESLEDKDPKDGCRVTRETWAGGASETEVLLLTIEGGGHTWPNGAQYLPERLIGKVCRDFDGTEVIWEFFKRHPKP